MTLDLKGTTPESWACIDCGINTAPGIPTQIEMERAFNGEVLKQERGVSLRITQHCEIYTVRDSVWKASGMPPMGGCLCIGCLEKRIGRTLRPKDFTRHVFNKLPGTERLMQRRGDK